MSEMKPCPFCGSTDIKLHDEISHAVWCQECFAEIPSIDIESTIELWNTRPIEDALQARIAELEAQQRWIPVGERLPEDGKPVWVCTIWNEQHSGFLIDGVWVGLFRDFREGEITHWMSLPVPPVNQLTAHDATERKDDKECEE